MNTNSNRKCPVTLPQIFKADFVGPMTEPELEGFAGIEGDGYMAEVDGYMVILDHSQESACLQVIGPDGTWWSLELPPELSGPC